jgi:hypothetical protein
LGSEDPAGLEELLRRLLLALSVDNLGTPYALGFGLSGDRADHGLVEVDILQRDIGDLNAPGTGVLVEAEDLKRRGAKVYLRCRWRMRGKSPIRSCGLPQMKRLYVIGLVLLLDGGQFTK